MHWKLWEKRQKEGEPSQAKAEKLPKPQDIPEPVGRHLVVQLGKDPDWVWNLKGLVRKRQDGEKSYDVRIYDLAMVAAKKVTVRDYTVKLFHILFNKILSPITKFFNLCSFLACWKMALSVIISGYQRPTLHKAGAESGGSFE